MHGDLSPIGNLVLFSSGIGWTNDLDRRLKAHNSGKGAKYTRSRLPVALVYFEELESQAEAQRRECEIKKLPRKRKLELIEKQ